MDRRIILPSGCILQGVRRVYTIDRYISAGSNSIVYQAHYQDSLMPEYIHSVLIKELYPLDPQGSIQRDGQRNLYVPDELRPFFEAQKRSFLAGNQAHLKLAADGSEKIAENQDSFEANGTLYTVLSARKGEVLSEFLREGRQFPTLTDAVVCVKNLLGALKAFHAHRFLHLDISPDNIFLLTPDEEGSFPTDVLLLDFNSVYSLERPQDNEYGFYLGKEGYMAPEVLLHREKEIGTWTDLYSVAVVFYEIIEGKKLGGDREFSAQENLISPYSRLLLHEKERTAEKLNEILRKGLEILPQNRYQNIAEMTKDLQELLNILNGYLREPEIPREARDRGKARGGKRRKGRLGNLLLGIAIGAGITAAGVGLISQTMGQKQPAEDTKLDLTQIPLETDPSVVLTEKNVRWPLEDNILTLQVQSSTSVRIMLRDYEHPRDLSDVFEEYGIFSFYSGKGDKRGWQFADLTYDFFHTEDNTMHMVLPFQDTNDFDLSYIGVVFANYNYDVSRALLDITSCVLTDGAGNSHEITDLIGSHLLYFDEENWQWNLTTTQNQDFVEDFQDIYGGNLTVDAQVCYLDPVLEVVWESENPEVAKVDPDGRITAQSRGQTVLTVTVTDKTNGESRSTQMLVNVTGKPL